MASLPPEAYYRHSKGGLFSDCKSCVSAARKRAYTARGDLLRSRVQERARTPFGIFYGQRACAARRGIEWLLSFEQWSEIWQASGKWAKRGIRRGQYVMARYGDRGPYAVGNVKIITTEANIAEHHSSLKNLRRERLTNVSELFGGEGK